MKILLSFVVSLAFLFSIGCGQSGTSTGAGSSGGGGGSESGLTGSVSVPRSTTTSVSLSLKSADNSDSAVSVSKASDSSEDSSSVSAAKAEEEPRIIVSKATVNDSNVSGPVELWTIDGSKLLDTCEAKQGIFYFCGFDCAKLDSSKQVLVKVFIGDDVITSVVDATNCTNGSTVAASESNSQTSVATQLTYQAGDSSATPDNVTSTFKAALADSTFKPKQVYQTQNGVFGIGAPVSVDSSQGAASAVGECIKSAMAALPMKPADIKKALEGGGVLSQCTSSVNLSTAASVLGKLPDATKKFFEDSTTAGKWCQDATSCEALYKTMGGYGESDLTAMKDNPSIQQSYLNQYATLWQQGVTTAFDKIKESGAGAVIGPFLRQFTTGSVGQFDAAKSLLDNMDFKNMKAADRENVAKSCFQQIGVLNGSAEFDLFKANAAGYATTIFQKPTIFVGAGGATIAQTFLDQKSIGGADFTGKTLCISDGECSGGESCLQSYGSPYCSASCAGKADGLGLAGCLCSGGSDCLSNNCSTRCLLDAAVTYVGGGYIRPAGTCTSNANCLNGYVCTSGTCQAAGGGGGGGPVNKYYAVFSLNADNVLKVYDINSTTGVPTPIAGTSTFATGNGPQMMAVKADGKYIYNPNNSGNGVTGFSIAAGTGALTALNSGTAYVDVPPGGGVYSTTINPLGTCLFVANSMSNNISAFTLTAATGALTAVAAGPYSGGAGEQGANTVLVNPAGTHLYVSHRTSNAIGIFTIESDCRLTELDSSSFSSVGSKPQGLAFAVKGANTYLYAADHGTDEICAWNITSVSNSTAPSAIDLAPADGGATCIDLGSGNRLHDVTVDPDSKFLYAALASSSTDGIYGYTIGANGLLTAVSGNPFSQGVSKPRNLQIDPTGKFLYVAAQGMPGTSAGGIAGFTINSTTGVLTAITGSPFTTGISVTSTPFDIQVFGIAQ